METLQAIKSRRSIRKFKSDMIPKDILDKIIELPIYSEFLKHEAQELINEYENGDSIGEDI